MEGDGWGEGPQGGIQDQDDTMATQGVICENCGSNKFYSQDGFFYCEICLTQSQDTRQYVERDEFVAGRLNQSAAVLRDKAKGKKKRPAKEKLTKWEALNCCLKLMTEKLIQIGFPPVLKSKVFQLWTAYLIKRKAVFLSPEGQTDFYKSAGDHKCRGVLCGCAVKKQLRKRGVERRKKAVSSVEGIDDDGDNFLSVSQSKRRRTQAKRKAMEKDYQDAISMLESAENYESVVVEQTSALLPSFPEDAETTTTNILPDLDSTVANSAPVTITVPKAIRKRKCKLTQPSSELQKAMRQKGIQSSRLLHKVLKPEQFTLKSAYILLFIALRQIGCNVILSDLFRLAWNGSLQMSSLKLILGEHSSIISATIDSLFSTHSVDFGVVQSISSSIMDLINYLGMTGFRYPRYLELLPKFFDDLTLPRELECFLRQMERLVPLESEEFFHTYKMAPYKVLPEFSILGSIIVAMKLLFGLDDVTEKYQSEFARAVNAIISKYSSTSTSQEENTSWTKLFVLEDWFSYLRLRDQIVKSEIYSPNLYTSGHQTTPSRIHSLINEMGGQKGENFDRPEEEIKRKSTLEMFSNYGKNHPDSNKISDVVNPYIGVSLPNEDIMRQYKSNYPSVNCPQFNVDKLFQSFTEARIDYVFKPKKYIPLLEKAGYRVKVIKGDARNYKKIKTIKEGEKVLVIFQPYAAFDEDIVWGLGCPESMKFLLKLSFRTLTGVDDADNMNNNNFNSFGKLVNTISQYFVKHCRVGGAQMMKIFPYDLSDSEPEYF